MSECAVHLSDSDFDREVLGSEVPVLVDLGVGMPAATTARYQVRSIPTLILFKAGRVVAQRVGSGSKPAVAKMVGAHL